MRDSQNRLPGNRELIARIHSNLLRAQGFVQTLADEIQDPSKIGPGTERALWEHQTMELIEQLAILEHTFNDIDLDKIHG